ncbi:MAG: hypothetical protein H6711_20675 [Myxococcales bacterium]|nr:hypothetical protein [Myxococcales bacterium]
MAACTPEPQGTDTTEDGSSSSSSSSSTTTSGCPVGSLGCMCTNGGGCDPGLVCSGDNHCMDDNATSTSTSTSTTSGSDATSTSSSTTATDSDTDAGPCDPNQGVVNDACPPETPYCSASGICGDCSVLVSCAAVDPEKAVCDLESGQCVQCNADEASACKGDAPICDEVVNACVGCSDHSQCPNSACDLVSGACMDEAKVLYVYGDDANSGNCTESIGGNSGSKDNPYCTLDFALTHAKGKMDPSGWTFRLLPGGAWPQPYFHIPGGMTPATYAVIAEGNDSTAAEIESALVVVDIKDNLTVYLDNLDIVGVGNTNLPKVKCLYARVFVTRSRIRGGAGAGIGGSNCELHVLDSTISQNKSEGIELTSGKLMLRNAFITDNGHDPNFGGGGISLGTAVAVDIAYSSIVMNHNNLGAVDSIGCTKAAALSTVRNSIIARSPLVDNESVACPNLVITDSLVDGGEMSGEGNVKMAPEDIVKLLTKEPVTGVYRWKGPDQAMMVNDIARWLDGDPRSDFEGDPRPVVNDTPDTPGADALP